MALNNLNPILSQVKKILLVLTALFAVGLFTSSYAYADGGDSGGGTTTGSCSPDHWEHASGWGGFNATGPCNGGKDAAYMSQVHAMGCYDHRGGSDPIVAIFWLANRGTSQWVGRVQPGGVTASMHNTVARYINGTGFSSDVKQVARNKIIGNTTTVICVWASEVTYKCNQLPNWDTAVHSPGAKGSDEYPGPDAAARGCLLQCPDQEDVRPDRKGDNIPKARADTDHNGRVSPAELGEWCFQKPTEYVNLRNEAYGTAYQGGSVQPGGPGSNLAAYGWLTLVAEGTSARPSGADAIEPQIKWVLSPFGQWLAAHPGATGDDLPTAAEAQAMNVGAQHAKVVLSQPNRNAFAQGGLLNVNEYTTYVPIIDSTTNVIPKRNWRWEERRSKYTFTWPGTGHRTRTSTRDCRPLAPGTWSNAGPATRNSYRDCNDWGEWYAPHNNVNSWPNDPAGTVTTGSGGATLGTQTQENTGFWQSLAVHCNANGFNYAAQKASVNVANGDEAKNWSGSAIGARKPNSDAANWLWGASASDPRNTNRSGFYNKECAYNGVRAADDNSTSNLPSKNPVLQSFLRDNQVRTVHFDLFVPRNEPGVVSYSPTDKAVTTTLTRWTGGTPGLPGVSDKGQFVMAPTGSTDPLFSVEQTPAPQQTNWTTSTWKSDNGAQVLGQYNSFDISGNWSSDKAQPQVFTIKWEYEPQVSNNITTTLGFGVNGARSYSTTTERTKVQGKVYGRFGSDTSPALFQQQQDNTGDDTTNALDGVMSFGEALNGNNQWMQNPNDVSPYYTAVRFVRVTAQ